MSDAVSILNAENAVLGSLLIDPSRITDILPRLREDDFSGAENRSIYLTIRQMKHSGARIDALTVADTMHADRALRSYLAELVQITPTAANAREYADIVAETGKRRRLREALIAGINDIDTQRESAEVVAEISNALRDYNEASKKQLLSPLDQIDDFFAYREMVDSDGNIATRTGYRTLDNLLGRGMINAGLYFLAARPGVGKTAFALNIAEYVGKTQGAVCYISLEMTSTQLMARRIAMEGGINSKILLTDRLTEKEYAKVSEATIALADHKVYITEEPMNVQKAVSIAQACKGVRLVVIDHFTLFLRPHKQPDHAEYAEIAHALTALAKTINAPVLCLIQLNRESDQRKGRPKISDLRGSGATEEDAAGVMILHGDSVDADARQEENGTMTRFETIYLDKNRFGDVGKVDMSFYPATNRFREAYVT
jgi:replicative DNA helicase